KKMSARTYKAIILLSILPLLLFAWFVALGYNAWSKAMYVRAFDLYSQGDWENSIREFKVVNRRHEMPGALFQLGCALEKAGRVQEAKTAWIRCIKITKGDGAWGIWATERLRAAERAQKKGEKRIPTE